MCNCHFPRTSLVSQLPFPKILLLIRWNAVGGAQHQLDVLFRLSGTDTYSAGTDQGIIFAVRGCHEHAAENDRRHAAPSFPS